MLQVKDKGVFFPCYMWIIMNKSSLKNPTNQPANEPTNQKKFHKQKTNPPQIILKVAILATIVMDMIW